MKRILGLVMMILAMSTAVFFGGWAVWMVYTMRQLHGDLTAVATAGTFPVGEFVVEWTGDQFVVTPSSIILTMPACMTSITSSLCWEQSS